MSMAMFGVRVPEDVARLLSRIDVPGEKVTREHMHITMMVFGDDLPIKEVLRIVEAAYKVTSNSAPFTVRTNLVSHFDGGDGGYPVIARVDSPALHQVWAEFCRAFDKDGVEYSKKFPVYKPHITLSYSDTALEDLEIPTLGWVVKELVVWGGDDGDEKISVTLPFGSTSSREAIAVKLASRFGSQR